ncbi:MAG: hypothetical protein HUJ90_03620 [Bacteroidales bacterium]|nr:hypothetical protein [Bacteroidales bacterium]
MKRLFLFAAYSKSSLSPALQFYIKTLSTVGDIVFYADNELNGDDREFLKQYTLYHDGHKHGEYDFGSYKRAYKWAFSNLKIENYHLIYFVNDSVYGPLTRPGENADALMENELQRMERLNVPAFAMVMNPHRGTPHLETWFVGMRREVCDTGWFGIFLDGVVAQKDKATLCILYETGLSRLLEAHSIPFDAPFHITGRGIYNNVESNFKMGLRFIKKNSFIRHEGSLGRQLKNVTDSLSADWQELIYNAYPTNLLTGSRMTITARYIKYLIKKLFKKT